MSLHNFLRGFVFGFTCVLLVSTMIACLSNRPAGPTVTYHPIWDKIPVTPRPDNKICWDPSDLGGRTWTELRNAPALMSSGISTGIAEGDISGSTLLGVHTFQIEPGVPLRVDFHVWYPKTELNKNALDLRYLFLLDEVMLKEVIKSSSGPYVDLTLQPDDEIAMKLIIPPLSPGVHDFIAVGLGNVKDEPESHGAIEMHYHRTTLVAGSVLQSKSRTYVRLPADGAMSRGDPSVSLLVNRSRSLEAWNWPYTRLPAKVGEPVEFNIYAGYQGLAAAGERQPQLAERMQFALLAFLDYQQVDITPGIPVLYGDVTRDNAFTRVATKLLSPNEPGRHDILVLRINHPGVPICVLHGPPGGKRFPTSVEAVRVAIESLAGK